MQIKHLVFAIIPLSAALAASAQTAVTPGGVTEQDFLADMPVILSVSRLAQRLDEAPGAVSILDRQFILASGARDVADLLRLVPGFQTTTSFETDAPQATYHGRSDDWANRIQVLVDGRSVYSGHLQGSAGMGWQTLALDDIERIEILRGSNSAAYGARAFLGVVNIISRDVRETIGSSGSIKFGENSVEDVGARLGWGDSVATHRLSIDTRADAGLRGAYGASRVARANYSSHWSLGAGHDLDLRVGALDIDAGRGTPGDAGNNARVRYMGSRFVQADWHTSLSADHDVLVSASRTEHTVRDGFPLETSYYDDLLGAPYSGTVIDFSARERNDAITVQYTVRSSPVLRSVMGVELRQEFVDSPSSFDARRSVGTQFLRVFGNAEWRLTPDLIFNGGAMAERIAGVGDTLSPRLMLNWNVMQGQTLRLGVSSAVRPPSAYEKYSDVKYYDRNGQNPLVWGVPNSKLTHEKVVVSELGYYGALNRWGIVVDARAFNERISDGVANQFNDPPEVPTVYLNSERYTISGAEYQVTWQPALRTRVIWSHTATQIDVSSSVSVNTAFRTARGAPRNAASLFAQHRLPSGVEFSMGYHWTDGLALQSSREGQPAPAGRLDVLIAKAFKLGRSRLEASFLIQNLGSPLPDGDRKFSFEQRAIVGLRIEN